MSLRTPGPPLPAGVPGRFRRRHLVLCLGAIILVLVAFRGTGRADPPTVADIMRGVVLDAGPSRSSTWYEPEQDYFATYDFKTFPAIRKEKNGQRSLTLRVIRKSDKGIGIKSLEFRVDGSSSTISLKRHDVDIDHHGCRVAERVDLEDQEALIRRIAAGKQNEVVVTGILSTDTYELPAPELEDFRRIVALYDRPDAFKGSVQEKATVTNPELILSSKVQPVFPQQARRRGARGSVVLEALIRKDGTVGDVKVVRSTACDCGFEMAAASAVLQWRYKPGTKDGQPIDVYFTVIVDFMYL